MTDRTSDITLAPGTVYGGFGRRVGAGNSRCGGASGPLVSCIIGFVLLSLPFVWWPDVVKIRVRCCRISVYLSGCMYWKKFLLVLERWR